MTNRSSTMTSGITGEGGRVGASRRAPGRAARSAYALHLTRAITERLCAQGPSGARVAQGARISHSGAPPFTGTADYESRMLADVYHGFYLRERATGHRCRA